jgi:hypothetical protein
VVQRRVVLAVERIHAGPVAQKKFGDLDRVAQLGNMKSCLPVPVTGVGVGAVLQQKAGNVLVLATGCKVQRSSPFIVSDINLCTVIQEC